MGTTLAPDEGMTRKHGQHGFSMVEVLTVIAVMGIVAIMAFPSITRGTEAIRLTTAGRSVAQSVAVAKMRAASSFTRARVFANRDTNTYAIQVWDRPNNKWITEGGALALGYGVAYGFGGVTAPPPNTQDELKQSPDCLDDDNVTPIGGTSCIVFNSRGIPIDPVSGSPTGNNALYVTNGIGVFGTTLTATPLVRLWWSPTSSTAWVRQ